MVLNMKENGLKALKSGMVEASRFGLTVQDMKGTGEIIGHVVKEG